MPGDDGTGPRGNGPMTGRGLGRCAGYSIPGYANPGYGRGLGLGRGFGRRYLRRGRVLWWRRDFSEPYYAPIPSREEEKTYLENTIKGLEEDIKAIRERIKELSKEKKENL